ncbi:hypothetical protein ACFLRB_02625 [Acidobacteriota bacterium]
MDSQTGERSNTNVESRVHAINDLLEKCWIRSIAILYQENQLGKHAEKTFRNQLQGLQKQRYLSLSFESTDTVRNQIRQILESRPDAVGFFCDPDCIAHLCSSLKIMNTGSHPYLPLTFSINDPHSLQGNLHLREHYFVSFTGLNNPGVFRLSKEGTSLFKPGEPIGLSDKIWHKMVLTYRIFGFPVFFNILFIIIGGLFLSILDIRRWHKGKFFYFIKNFNFLLLFFSNIAIGLVLYIYLGERGTIRYDSFTATFILTFVSAAVLRANFFYTSRGNPIGLAKYYDCFVLWVFNQNLPGKPYINSIAYYNTVDRMRGLLEHTYKGILCKEKRIRMRSRFEDILSNCYTLLAARKALARLLLQNPRLAGLYGLNLNHVLQKDGSQPLDPEEIIKKVMACCGQNKDKEKLIDEKLKEKLAELKSSKPEKFTEIKSTGTGEYDESYFLNKDLEGMQESTDSIKYKITLLFLIRGDDFLKDIGCLS